MKVFAGWAAVAVSCGFAALVGPAFRDRIFRHEDAWRHDSKDNAR